MRPFGAALCAAMLSLSLAPAAHASSTDPGTISEIIAFGDGGVVFFNLSGARSTLPTCNGSTLPTRWAIDASTIAGQAKLAILLSAYGLGKKIQVFGTGACPLWPDTETAGWFVVKD